MFVRAAHLAGVLAELVGFLLEVILDRLALVFKAVRGCILRFLVGRARRLAALHVGVGLVGVADRVGLLLDLIFGRRILVASPGAERERGGAGGDDQLLHGSLPFVAH